MLYTIIINIYHYYHYILLLFIIHHNSIVHFPPPNFSLLRWPEEILSEAPLIDGDVGTEEGEGPLLDPKEFKATF